MIRRMEIDLNLRTLGTIALTINQLAWYTAYNKRTKQVVTLSREIVQLSGMYRTLVDKVAEQAPHILEDPKVKQSAYNYLFKHIVEDLNGVKK